MMKLPTSEDELLYALFQSAICGNSEDVKKLDLLSRESGENMLLAQPFCSILNYRGLHRAIRNIVRSLQLACTWSEWLHSSSQQANNGYARFCLGEFYSCGIGVVQDQSEAIRLYSMAADQGIAAAQCNLGYCYDIGDGVDQDKCEAARLYRLAADQGFAAAQCTLVWATLWERVLTRTKLKLSVCIEWPWAKAWHLRSALLEYVTPGDGVEPDSTEAVRLYRLAADQGNLIAQYNMAVQCVLTKALE